MNGVKITDGAATIPQLIHVPISTFKMMRTMHAVRVNKSNQPKTITVGLCGTCEANAVWFSLYNFRF